MVRDSGTNIPKGAFYNLIGKVEVCDKVTVPECLMMFCNSTACSTAVLMSEV